MDRQVQDHENPPIADGYPFATQGDSFNTFQTDDHDTSFTPSWYNHSIPNQSPAFLQGNDPWHSNGNPLHASSYGAPPGGYDRVYSRSPASFNYPGYDPRRSQTFSQPTYNSASAYTNGSVNDGTQFGYPNIHQPQPPPNHGQTISPRILQNFLNPYGQQHFAPEIRQAQQAQANANLARQNGFGSGPEYQLATVSSLIAVALPASSPHEGIVFKPPAGISAMNRHQVLRQVGAGTPKQFKGSLFAIRVSNVENISQSASLKDRDKNGDKARRSPARINNLLRRVYGTSKWNDRYQYIQRKLRNLEDKYAGIITSESMSPSSIEDNSDEDASDSSDSDSELNLHNINPLPPVRSSDPIEAVKYDVIEAVWAKHSLGLSGTIIRTALGKYSDVLNVIRNQWKAAQAALSEAEKTSNQAGVTEAKKRIDKQRQIAQAAAATTLEHGHQDILEKLGEVPALALVLNYFLQDSAKEGIWSGPLIQTLLELLESCKTVDTAWLEKCKLDKLLVKLVKKGTKPVIEYAQKILETADARSAHKEPQVGDHDIKGVKTAGIDPASPSGRTLESLSGIKRQRSLDGPNAQPAKKLAFNPISSRDEVPPKSVAKARKADSSKKSDIIAGTKPATAPPPKIKSTHVAPKPTNFFSSLQSASKKPGTSNAALQSAKAKDGKPNIPSETKATIVPGTASKPAFSFAETMANLNKPKEHASAKTEDIRPPETDEEKTKRLRRESRRSLRVSFKPDDSLVEIRTFVHDPDEELGHDDSMVRDVGDLRQEGQTLKMHRDLDVPDDEDDNGMPEETSLVPWALPSLVDFSVVDREERERNCSTRGGDVNVKSQERALQEQRELTTLMVIYTTDSDIPSSPREPSDPYSGESTTEVSFGAVPDEIKARETQYYSARDPYYRQTNEPAAPPSQTPDISALLRALNNGQQQQQQQQQQVLPQQTTPQVSTSGLEAIFARFANSDQQAAPVQAPQPVQQSPSVPPFNLQAMLGAMQQNNLPPQTYPIPPPPNQVTDLSAILAQFGQQQPAAQAQAYNYGNNYPGDTRKRQSDYEDQRDGKRQKPISEKKPFYGVPRVPCKFFQEGSCRKGDKCTFLHE